MLNGHKPKSTHKRSSKHHDHKNNDKHEHTKPKAEKPESDKKNDKPVLNDNAENIIKDKPQKPPPTPKKKEKTKNEPKSYKATQAQIGMHF